MGINLGGVFSRVYGAPAGSKIVRPEMYQNMDNGRYVLGFNAPAPSPRGKVNVADFKREFPALQFLLNQYLEDPEAEETHFLSGVEELMGRSDKAQALFSYLAYARRKELVETHRINATQLEEIIHAGGRKNVLVIGNSGIKEESVREQYIREANALLHYTFGAERRIGNDPRDKNSLSLSLTNGVVEQIVRSAAYAYDVSIAAYGNEWFLKSEDFVDPDDKTMPPVYMTGDDDYSPVSVGNSDMVVALGGGGFVFSSDLVDAIGQGKPTILHLFDFLPTYTTMQVESNPSGRAKVLANVAKALLKEDWAFKELLAKVQARFPGKEWTINDLKKSIKITRTKEQFAEAWHKFNGNKGKLSAAFKKIYKQPILTVTSNELPEHEIEKIRRRMFDGALFFLSLTGRTQFDNREAGAREKRIIQSYLNRFAELQRDRYGMSPYHTVISHGMSDKGTDWEFLSRFLAQGFRGFGVVKPEYFGSVTDLAMRLSPFMFTPDDYTLYSKVYVSLSDVLQVFEGNAGVMDHIDQSFNGSIPVIATDVTNNPSKGMFWDQESKRWKYRVINVNQHLREQYPEGREGLAFSNSPERLARFAYEVALARRRADTLEVG